MRISDWSSDVCSSDLICPYFPSPAPCGVLFSLTTALSGTRRLPPVAARRAAHDRIRTPDPCRPAARAERGHVLRRQGNGPVAGGRRNGGKRVRQGRQRTGPRGDQGGDAEGARGGMGKRGGDRG